MIKARLIFLRNVFESFSDAGIYYVWICLLWSKNNAFKLYLIDHIYKHLSGSFKLMVLFRHSICYSEGIETCIWFCTSPGSCSSIVCQSNCSSHETCSVVCFFRLQIFGFW